jgi:hypothetical protein
MYSYNMLMVSYNVIPSRHENENGFPSIEPLPSSVKMFFKMRSCICHACCSFPTLVSQFPHSLFIHVLHVLLLYTCCCSLEQGTAPPPGFPSQRQSSWVSRAEQLVPLACISTNAHSLPAGPRMFDLTRQHVDSAWQQGEIMALIHFNMATSEHKQSKSHKNARPTFPR